MPKSQSWTVPVVGALFAALLSACGTGRQAVDNDSSAMAHCPPCGASSPASPVKPLRAASWSELPGWSDDDLAAAWPAFLRSCRTLVNRPPWKAVCEDARTLNVSTPTIRRFLESRLQPWRVVNADGTTTGLVTGYYEPLLRGSRTRGAPYLHPVLGVPDDLLVVDLGTAQPEVKNLRLRGRLQGNKVVPYYSRAEIVGREKEFANRALLWVDDAVELFFLQVQGSGRIKLADGSLVRVNYADQNGYPYQSIGRVLVERGELKLEEASMQGIQA
ncbi:MAG TPA: MltA domain-containing protein, partial [Accumulibacter sp.]|nr:MltA domain-containing protein [Accumulibacter sp.]